MAEPNGQKAHNLFDVKDMKDVNDVDKETILKKDEGNTPFNLTEVDRDVLLTKEEDFHLQSWDDLKKIIANNDLHLLRRTPSDLTRYIAWSKATKATHGSIPNYIMTKRLHWKPLSSSTTSTGPQFAYESPVPFTSPNDYKILPNDWPYGFEPDITHLVVWMKNRLETESKRGDMTSKSRQLVEDFVQRQFVERVEGLPGKKEKVQWFKNWAALQSVPGMEHVHVLVRDIPKDIILDWTRGEVIVQELAT